VHDVMGCVGVMYGDGDQHLHFGLDGKGSGGAGYDCGVQDVMMVVLVLCAGTVISISILASMAREVEVRGTTAVCKKAIRKGQCPRLRTGACQANSYYLRLRHCSLYKHTYLQQQRSHQGRSVPQTPHRGVSSEFLLLAIASLLTLQTHSPPTAEEPSGEVSAPEPTGDSIVVLRPPLPSVLLRLLSTR